MWRIFRGKAATSNEVVAYKRTVALLCKVAGLKPLQGKVKLTLLVYRPRKAGDLSNRIKVLEDALQGYAYNDDSQVVVLHAERHDDAANPRAEVEVVAVG